MLAYNLKQAVVRTYAIARKDYIAAQPCLNWKLSENSVEDPQLIL